ncbi:MAG: prolyl oligopeptidase family serine peptidase [Tannerella sp.]|nr:prolyl oligopeptidase family serine peptidase [Tannerella sp.]
MRIILFCLALLPVFLTNQVKGQTTNSQSFVTTPSQPKPKADYNYLLYLPKDYAVQTRSYPLVIYLHGGSHKGTDLNKLKEYGLPYLVDQGKDFDFILVSPQCPDNKYWSIDDWFEPLYIKLLAEYRIDIEKVYLTGISMGGYGAFIVAMDYPDKFAAIVPLCGGCNDSDTIRICNLKNIPVWTFHGTADDLIPISETERIVDALNQCKGKIKFTKLKGEGHGIQYLYEKYPKIYKWMLKQQR